MKTDRTTRSKDTEEEDESFDLGHLLRTLRRKWWLVPACLLFTMGLGVFYVTVTPKTYRSEEVVQVEQSETKLLNIEDLKAEDLKQDQILKTFEQNLLSGEVLGRVIDRLKLTPADLGLKPRDTEYLPQEMVEALNKQVSSKLERGTRLIDVSADSTDPKTAQVIATTIVSEYVQNDLAQRSGVSGEANRFLLIQADELKKRVETAEQAAQAYKDAHPGVPLDDSQSYTEEKLRDLTNRVNDARQARIHLQADYEQAQAIFAKFTGADQVNKLLALQSVANDPGVLEAQKSLAEQQAGLAALAQRYLPRHPVYIQEQSKTQEFRAALDRAVVKAAGGLGTAVATARDGETQIDEILKQAERAKLETDRLAIPYVSLTREVDRNRTLYDSIQERLKETEITANVDANNIRIVTPASLPYKPVKPKTLLVLVGSFMVGLMMSIGIAFAFTSADQTLQSIGQAESELQLPAVGAIPMGDRFGPPGSGFPILSKPHTPLAESFRTLRTALDLLDDEAVGQGTQRRSLLFTSAVPSEGKSFCSVNYAISVAQLGRKTLLVDADLRLPVLEAVFFAEKKTNGLSPLLEGVAPLQKCYYATEVPNLFFMPAGKRSQSPAELMANNKFPDLLKEMLAEFDRVIVDSAPVHAVSDTLLITKHLDATCLVVNSLATPVHVSQAAILKLQRANSKLAGFILNRVQQNSSYYYYGGGSYGKGVYGAPSESEAKSEASARPSRASVTAT